RDSAPLFSHPPLARDLLRHGFAEPSQQDAGASRRAPHMLIPSPVKPARRVAGSWRETHQKRQFYPFGAAVSPDTGRIGIAKTVAQSAAGLLSGRIANRG